MTSTELTGYRFTPKAEQDLEDIWLYTARTWSEGQAETYIDSLFHTIETLMAMPTIARERSEFTPPVRIHAVAEHLIIYLTDGAILVIVRILGSRQNWRAMLEIIDS